MGDAPQSRSGAGELVGRTVGQFRVEEVLGRGGMGIVYRARDTTRRRPVALKVLPPDLVADSGRRRRFLREAQSVAAVSHPNIAMVYEVGEDSGVVYIAMELVAGRTVRTLIDEEPLPIARIVDIVAAIADALARAHAAGVIHRDVKPANVMLSAMAT